MTNDQPFEDITIHPLAIVETNDIGAGTTIWAYAHILPGARIGNNCVISDHTFIEGGVAIGDAVTIKNACLIFDGVTISGGAFIGPGVRFTNDARPRSPRAAFAKSRYRNRDWLLQTHVGCGASLGAGVVVLAGTQIGDYAMVGAGSVVTRDVPAHAVVMGNPARHRFHTCVCGGSTWALDSAVACEVLATGVLTCDGCRLYSTS